MSGLDSKYGHELEGLARTCPWCGLIAHYECKGRKERVVYCKLCDKPFEIKKYRKGERPKARRKFSSSFG